MNAVSTAGNRNVPWKLLGRLLVAAALVAGATSASAQTCDAGEPWVLNGSDTLETMTRQSIVNATLPTAGGVLASCGNRCQTANSLILKGTCSITTAQACGVVKGASAATNSTTGVAGCPAGESCVFADTQAAQTCASSPECAVYGAAGFPVPFCGPTSELFYAGGGSTTGETNLRNNVQSWAPMSRNLRDTVVFTSAAQTTRRSFCRVTPTVECTTNAALCTGVGDACLPRNWDFIYPRNVVALDAAVVVTPQGGVKNIDLPIVGTNESQAAPNTTPATFTFLSPGSGYTQLLAIVLAGTDGSGSFKACADPRRVNAVQDLAALQGTPSGTLAHFYRRDDNSGTTDTVKERLSISRFCNGRAVGINGANKTNPNVNNQDYDPIRRPCALLPGQRETTCTDVTVTPPVACKASDNNPNCTQGLVVALSVGDNDTTLVDATDTIGARVGADVDSMGYAGRAAVKNPAFLASGPSIRTRTTGDGSVRLGLYMMARRLHIHYADWDGDPNSPSAATPGGYALGGTVNHLGTVAAGVATPNAARLDAEERLWNWMTEPGGAGRANFNPIAVQKGFVTCDDDPSVDVCGITNNLCCTPNPGPLFPGAPAACVPGSGGGGPAFWPVDDGNAATNLGGSIASSTAAQICCSDLTSIPANTAGVCPEVARLAPNSPCGKNSDCASGVCADVAAIGINVCQ